VAVQKHNKMENWNRNDWQGKRKNQVEYSGIVIFGCMICGVVFGVVVSFLYFCNVI